MLKKDQELSKQEQLEAKFNQLISDFISDSTTDSKRLEIARELITLAEFEVIIKNIPHQLRLSKSILSPLQECYQGFSLHQLQSIIASLGPTIDLSAFASTSIQNNPQLFPDEIILRNLDLRPYDTLVALGSPQIKEKIKINVDSVLQAESYKDLSKNLNETLSDSQHLDLILSLFNSNLDFDYEELLALADAGNKSFSKYKKDYPSAPETRSGDALLIKSRRFAKDFTITGPDVLENFITRNLTPEPDAEKQDHVQILSFMAIQIYTRQELSTNTIARVISWFEGQSTEDINMIGLVTTYLQNDTLVDTDFQKEFSAEEVINAMIDLQIDKKESGKFETAIISTESSLLHRNSKSGGLIGEIKKRAPDQYSD